MAVILPKDLRGFRYVRAVPFELNEALIDIMLPNLFQRAILENRDLAQANIDASDIDGPTRRMAESDRLTGFGDNNGRRLLDKLVKSSLITIGYKGAGRKASDKQIEGIVPYSIASFKTGLPKSRTRLRNIDQFIYHLLLVEFKNDAEKVSEFLSEVFGEGVKVRGYPEPGFERTNDPVVDLDILTDLSITYLEGLESVTPRKNAPERLIAQPLPGYQQRVGDDLYRYLWSYRERIPTSSLIDQIVTLIALEIVVFTFKLMETIPELTGDPSKIPLAMTIEDDIATGPELFVDMSGDPRGLSSNMAATCVRRDLSSIDPFVRSILQLRYIDGLTASMSKNPAIRPRLENMLVGSSTSDFLKSLLNLKSYPDLELRVEAMASHDVDRIVQANLSPDSLEEVDAVESPIQALLESFVAAGFSVDDQVVEFLYLAQAASYRSSIVKWIRDLGGANKPYGLVRGRTDRRSWVYAPGNDLLTVLIQLKAIDYKGWNPAKGANPVPFGVRDFLEWLEDRFGIIVDRPPSGLGFDGPEHMAAARENLKAMLRRLRQMGVFEDQSDDFSVQMLTPPYMDSSPVHTASQQN